MLRLFLLLTLLLSSAAHAASSKKAATAPPPDAKQWTLPNGLAVVFLAEHKAPIATVQVFYRVGAKDEPADKRGIAHMFEHMMFKGSQRVRPELHAQFVASVGGEDNAFTSDDVTGYHNTVPPAAVDFVLKLEADRMRGLVLQQSTIDSEREVVKEELRMRVENSPVGKARLRALELAFTKHPYRIAAIGKKEMIDSITLEDCQQFYDRYYQPNNAILVVVGDLDEGKLRESVEKHFGPIPRGKDIERTQITEPAQTETREDRLQLPVQRPVMMGAYHTVPASSEDQAVFDVLQTILSDGQSSRLYQRLVRKDKLAVSAGGFVLEYQDPGLFALFAAFLPDADTAKIRAALLDEIKRIVDLPVGGEELRRAKNQLATSAAFRRERVTSLAMAIGTDAVMANDPLRLWKMPARYDAVTAADIQRVAKRYLQPSNLSLVTLVPAAQGGAK